MGFHIPYGWDVAARGFSKRDSLSSLVLACDFHNSHPYLRNHRRSGIRSESKHKARDRASHFLTYNSNLKLKEGSVEMRERVSETTQWGSHPRRRCFLYPSTSSFQISMWMIAASVTQSLVWLQGGKSKFELLRFEPFIIIQIYRLKIWV